MHVRDMKIFRSIKMEALTQKEYNTIKDQGLLYEFYPEATGSYNNDVLGVDKPNRPDRIDIIGQNGNDGYHYKLGDDGNSYRVPFSDNAEATGFGDWPHVHNDSYSDKIKKVVENLYDLPKDNMFVRTGNDTVLGMDMINNPISPSHYEIGNTGLEAIDVIEATLTKEEYIGYLRGNLLKYHLRAHKKNGSEDLQKADVYSGWLVAALEVEE